MNNQLATTQDDTLNLNQLKEQINLIQHVMKDVMKKDEHYGVIQGCGDKPTLLKAGAEKLAFVFRLCPEFIIEEKNLDKAHKEYRIVCTMKGRDGTFLGQGVGVASTMETKWRYRSEVTDNPVPKEYWEKRDPELLGGSQFSARKVAGQWVIVHKVEHDNPQDYYNTCLKMAKKRAQVDATLTCTAASDIFTQDIEEMAADGTIEVKSETVKETPKPRTKVEGEQTIRGQILDVQSKSGTKNGKPWTNFTVNFVSDDNKEYSATTFDAVIGGNAQNDVGVPVELTIRPNQRDSKYTDLLDVRIAKMPESVEQDDIPF